MATMMIEDSLERSAVRSLRHCPEYNDSAIIALVLDVIDGARGDLMDTFGQYIPAAEVETMYESLRDGADVSEVIAKFALN